MELPQKKGEVDKALWTGELFAFKQKVEDITGNKITASALSKATALLNTRRVALKRLYDLRKADPAPISGLDALLPVQVSFFDDPLRLTQKVNDLWAELENRVINKIEVAPPNTPRILISGSPMVIPNWKIHSIIESSGAVVVGEESCTGTRLFNSLDTGIKENDLDTQIKFIAERQLKTNCACFTPNKERLEDILDFCREYKVDGVIHYALLFCQPYMLEAVKIKRFLDQKKIPLLTLETDYGIGDVEQIRTRVQAFIEMLNKK
jgi:benzoyl-CoA reductase/2-hydroxyglutaryl-CoA dehydratase subunit BcrC/BadD/HgdB